MTYRRIDTKIWQDPWVEGLSTEEKLLFVYLTTNECCNQAGLYQISVKRISFETGITQSKISDLLKKLYPKIEMQGQWLWVKNFTKYQTQNESFFTAARREAHKAPESLYNKWLDYNLNNGATTVLPQCQHGVTRNPSSDTDTDTDTDTEKEKKDSSEPKINSEPPPPAITFPLIDKDGEFHITHAMVSEWQACYPAVDVIQSLREMRAWCLANKSKRKTRQGAQAFVVRWLSKEQNRGGNTGLSSKPLSWADKKRMERSK